MLGWTALAALVLAPIFGLAEALLAAWGPPAPMDGPGLPAPIAGASVAALVAGMCIGVGSVVALTAGIHERYAIEPPSPGLAIRATRRNWLAGTILLGLPSALLFLLASQPLSRAVRAGIVAVARPQLPADQVLLLLALAAGLVGGLAVGPLVRLAIPVEGRCRIVGGLLVGIVTAAVMGPAQYVFVQILRWPGIPVEFWIVPDVPVWPFAATLAGLIVVFGGSERTGAIAGLIATVTAGTWFVRVGSIALFALFPPAIWPIFLATITLVYGMRVGGGAFLRHWTLRWLLARNGFAPLDCVPFLERASQLNLLRRRGGGYQFAHRLVLEHFSARDEPGPGR